MADMPQNQSAGANSELDRLRALVKELTDENAQLKLRLEDVQVERDSFLSALRFYAPGQVFTAEDLLEFQKTAVSSDEVMAEVEAILRKAS